MSTATVRSGVDTWVTNFKPSANRVNAVRMVVYSGRVFSLLYFQNPAPRGATIISATLRVVSDDPWSGSRTITVKRVTQGWKAGRVNYNSRPSVTSTGAVAVTKSGPGANTVWEFDVTAHLQLASDGTAWYGWQLESNVADRKTFYSLNAGRHKPTLTVVWSDAPDAPTTLVPDGGVVSLAKPVLRCDYTDVSGSTDMAAIQVQIDAADDFTAPDFDSGEVASTEPELDLATTAYAGLATGATTYWRVRVKDGAGLWSAWSASASFTSQAKGAVSITNPAASPSNFVEEYTPPISWSHTGTTQAAYQVLIADTAYPSTYLHNSGKILGTANSYTLPAGVLRDGRTYRVVVRTWDQYSRENTPGDTPWVFATRDFTVQYSATPTPPSGESAAQQGQTPGITLSWQRGSAPDSWTIERDGAAIVTDLDPADTLVSGTSHAWTDWTAAPNTQHTYRIRAVVNGQMSSGGTDVTAEIPMDGIWLGDPDSGQWALIRGDGIEWEHAEDSATYTPLDADHVVRIVAGLRGLEGNVDGPMRASADFTIDQMRAAVWTVKEQPNLVYRLVAGTVNIPVVVGNVSMRPHSQTKPGRPVEHVSFEFWQKGELPFEAKL